jgi:hypothetical protein
MHETYYFLALTGAPSTWAAQMNAWTAANPEWTRAEIICYQPTVLTAAQYFAWFKQDVS